jgi:hypothetical protein
MRTAFIDTLCDLASRDERVWLLTADLGYSVLEQFATRFPDRYVNVGVAEQNMIGIAAGLARTIDWYRRHLEEDAPAGAAGLDQGEVASEQLYPLESSHHA